MRVAIVTDAWHPQINGVVRTLERTRDELRRLGHDVALITPELFATAPCPTYPEIRLALRPAAMVRALLEGFRPDAVHIATEGPLGLAARAHCRRTGFPFTTSFHTRFAEYVKLRFRLPLRAGYAWLRWFHGAAARTLVATDSLAHELQGRGFANLARWCRGVDTDLFQPRPKDALPGPRPIFLYVGRVAVEKNVEAFLALDLPGTRYVVGDGPDLELLRGKYPAVRFTGAQTGLELARCYAAADAFVFPSRTDTFGLVMLEALACGVPVAAYPVPGPQDVIVHGRTGFLDEDLRAAALNALSLSAADCREHALKFSWRECTLRFLDGLCLPAPGAPAEAARRVA